MPRSLVLSQWFDSKKEEWFWDWFWGVAPFQDCIQYNTRPFDAWSSGYHLANKYLSHKVWYYEYPAHEGFTLFFVGEEKEIVDSLEQKYLQERDRINKLTKLTKPKASTNCHYCTNKSKWAVHNPQSQVSTETWYACGKCLGQSCQDLGPNAIVTKKK